MYEQLVAINILSGDVVGLWIFLGIIFTLFIVHKGYPTRQALVVSLICVPISYMAFLLNLVSITTPVIMIVISIVALLLVYLESKTR